MVTVSISGCAKWRCVLGQGNSPDLTRGIVPVLTVSRSGASPKWLNVNVTKSRPLQKPAWATYCSVMYTFYRCTVAVWGAISHNNFLPGSYSACHSSSLISSSHTRQCSVLRGKHMLSSVPYPSSQHSDDLTIDDPTVCRPSLRQRHHSCDIMAACSPALQQPVHVVTWLVSATRSLYVTCQ